MSQITSTPIDAVYSASLSTTGVGLSEAPFSFSVADIEATDEVLINVETASIRITFDGTAASDTVGHLYTTGKYSFYGWELIRNMKLASITTSSVSITLFSNKS